MAGQHEYLFDVKLFASIRVKADSEVKARKMLIAEIDCNTGIRDPLMAL